MKRNLPDRRTALLILALLPFVSLPLLSSQFYFRHDDSAYLLWAKEFAKPFYYVFSPDPTVNNFANYPGMGAYRRPFAYLFIMAIWHLFGPTPVPYHVLAGLTFIAAIYFLFRFVEQRSGVKAAVLSCLALFAAFHDTMYNLFLLIIPVMYFFQIGMIYCFYSYLQQPCWFYLVGMLFFVGPSMDRQTTPIILAAILLTVLFEQRRKGVNSILRKSLPTLGLLGVGLYAITLSPAYRYSSILNSANNYYEVFKFLSVRFFYYGTILTSGITGIFMLLFLSGGVLQHVTRIVKEQFHFHRIDLIWPPVTVLLALILMKLPPYGIYWLVFCCLYLFIFDEALRVPIAWAGASVCCFLAVWYYDAGYLLESGLPFAMVLGIILSRLVEAVVLAWEKHFKSRLSTITAVASGMVLLVVFVVFVFSGNMPILSGKIEIIRTAISSSKNFAQLMNYLQSELPRGAIVYEFDETELGTIYYEHMKFSLKQRAERIKIMNIKDKQIMLKVLGRDDIKIYPAFHLNDSVPQGKAYFIVLNNFEKEIALARFRLEVIREFQSHYDSAVIYRIIPEPELLGSSKL